MVTPETRDEAPRAETVKWSLPVTGRAGDGFRRWMLEGDLCRDRAADRELSEPRLVTPDEGGAPLTMEAGREEGGVILSGVCDLIPSVRLSCDPCKLDVPESNDALGVGSPLGVADRLGVS